jgi:chromosomal replication initiator protein
MLLEDAYSPLAETLRLEHKARQARYRAVAIRPVRSPPPPPKKTDAELAQELEARQKAKEERIAALRLALLEEYALSTVRSPSMRSIVHIVADAYEIAVNELLSHRRTQRFCLARQVAYYLCKVTTTKSLPEIGMAIGNRDHTTIMYGVRQIAARIAVDDEFRDKVNAIRARIEGRG